MTARGLHRAVLRGRGGLFHWHGRQRRRRRERAVHGRPERRMACLHPQHHAPLDRHVALADRLRRLRRLLRELGVGGHVPLGPHGSSFEGRVAVPGEWPGVHVSGVDERENEEAQRSYDRVLMARRHVGEGGRAKKP